MRLARVFWPVLVGAALSMIPLPAEADRSCATNGICIVGVPSGRVTDMQAANTQQESQWCWAASISMAFGFYGHRVEQADIVRAIWGQVVNLPAANGSMIIAALARKWTDANGHSFRAHGQFTDLTTGVGGVNNNVIAAELAANRPLIVGTQGHAMLVTAMTYVPDALGSVARVLDVTVPDPWPSQTTGQGVRRTLSASEMAPFFITTISSIENLDTGVPEPDPSRRPGPRPDPPDETVVVACTHPAHPMGDVSACTHQAHPMGDSIPCQHPCFGPFGGMVPCHPRGDVIPCSHPAHPRGDISECRHPLHPGGDRITRPRRRRGDE